MYITYWIYYGSTCEKNYFDLLRNEYYINGRVMVDLMLNVILLSKHIHI